MPLLALCLFVSTLCILFRIHWIRTQPDGNVFIYRSSYTRIRVCMRVCVCERVQFARTSVSCNLIPRTKRYHLSHNRRTQIQIKIQIQIQIQVQIRIQMRSSKYKKYNNKSPQQEPSGFCGMYQLIFFSFCSRTKFLARTSHVSYFENWNPNSDRGEIEGNQN